MNISAKTTLCTLALSVSTLAACAPDQEDAGPVETNVTQQVETLEVSESVPARLQPMAPELAASEETVEGRLPNLLSLEIGDDGEPHRASPRSVEAAPAVTEVPEEARVPDTLSGDVDCPERAAPSLCGWAGSADGVALVEITAVRAERADVVALDPAAGKYVPTETCQTIRPALRIEARVVEPLMGDLPSSLSVAVGAEQRGNFQPLPVASEEDLVWRPTERSDVGPLRVGAQVVMAVHRVESGYSLMGDLIAGVDAAGQVYAPHRTGDCMGGAPEGISGSIDTVKQNLSSCAPASKEASELRAERRARWGAIETPAKYRAASCVDPVEGFEELVGGPEDFDPATSSDD